MSEAYALVTGGAGFVGTNLVHRLAERGQAVLVFDNLSRPGVERNLAWLLTHHADRVRFVHGDVRNAAAVNAAVQNATAVYHLAAQVAVTTSLVDPVSDFEINARGTLNVLEAVRARKQRPFLAFTSTNKVLGGLDGIELREGAQRYEPTSPRILDAGIGEEFGIEFCSPYGCSKGAADQYVLDYARCYDIPATVFRMSCIYGPHQCGNEDQGWVAHFVKQAIERQPITFFGDGKQVRDALFVDDLVDAFLAAEQHIDRTRAQAYNIGGGPGNSVSLLELVDHLAAIGGYRPEVLFQPWRQSDQRYYVSDTRRFREATGWRSQTSVPAGLRTLYGWLERAKAEAPAPELRWERAERSA